MKSFIIILLIIANITNSFCEKACTNNLICSEGVDATLCCIDGFCKPSSECRKQNTAIYIGTGVVAGVFVLITIFYMIYNVRTIKESIEKMTIELNEKEEKGRIRLNSLKK